ncbi:MAG: hypothetical protein KQ78_00859 [Candidatus Izimaplasma bacterium HR2]|nr:MAG: hypothetical protein KQ78_00859 [Candidatus Izimaplasma bacterium HR2]
MKKLIIAFSLVLIIGLLSGCGWRERLLAPPDEFTVPEGSLVAVCTKDDDVYKFVFKDDGVYQYFINDVEQSEDDMEPILEQAYLHDSSVENYLNDEYPGACTITDYVSEEE